jgi:hypothetical protein
LLRARARTLPLLKSTVRVWGILTEIALRDRHVSNSKLCPTFLKDFAKRYVFISGSNDVAMHCHANQ